LTYAGYPTRIKIGYTDSTASVRIPQLINESTPDTPILLFEVRTDRPREPETALHRMFADRRVWVDGRKSEFFEVRLDEIRTLLRTVQEKTEKDERTNEWRPIWCIADQQQQKEAISQWFRNRGPNPPPTVIDVDAIKRAVTRAAADDPGVAFLEISRIAQTQTRPWRGSKTILRV
jgi:hypothetical protein